MNSYPVLSTENILRKQASSQHRHPASTHHSHTLTHTHHTQATGNNFMFLESKFEIKCQHQLLPLLTSLPLPPHDGRQ